MKNYEIKIEPTSNPSIVKFEANHFLTDHSSFEFENIDAAKKSPLAQQLFYLPFVKRIFIAQNFVAIDKYDIVTWADVQEEVALQIKEYLNSGQEVVQESTVSNKKLPVTIYAESTPNPSVQKFVANKKLVLQTYEIKNIDEAKTAPLAQALFQFPFVKEIFFDENYISITKHDMVEWNDISAEIREFLRTYLEQGKPVLDDHSAPSMHTKTDTVIDVGSLDSISQEIIAILEEHVKPAVASDGGNIAFSSYDQNTKAVHVVLQGACSGCPSSTVTLKNGIETMLKEMLPGKIERVTAVNG